VNICESQLRPPLKRTRFIDNVLVIIARVVEFFRTGVGFETKGTTWDNLFFKQKASNCRKIGWLAFKTVLLKKYM
jgi:hypothetical protein